MRDGGTGEWVAPIETPSSSLTAPNDAPVSSVDWSPTAACSRGDGLGTGRPLRRGHGGVLAEWTESRGRSVMHVQFSPDGSTLAVGLANDVLDGTVPETEPRPRPGPPRRRCPRPGRRDARRPRSAATGVTMARTTELAIGCSSPTAAIGPPAHRFRCDLSVRRSTTSRRSPGLARRESDVIDAGFSPDGARIVVGGGAGRIAVLDAADGTEVVDSVAAHDGFTEHVSFSPDGRVGALRGHRSARPPLGCGRPPRRRDLRRRRWDLPGGSTARFMDGGDECACSTTSVFW